MIQIILSTLLLSAIHTAIPNHWIPVIEAYYFQAGVLGWKGIFLVSASDKNDFLEN
ncbi:MAG: hypothetical protein NTV01_20805 [Bacteroidia bacterium]|nr:hypothetical protein [Bacteroidia bacterium]